LPPRRWARGAMNFQPILSAKQAEDIDTVCGSLSNRSLTSASSLYEPTKFVPLSLLMVRGLPQRLPTCGKPNKPMLY